MTRNKIVLHHIIFLISWNFISIHISIFQPEAILYIYIYIYRYTLYMYTIYTIIDLDTIVNTTNLQIYSAWHLWHSADRPRKAIEISNWPWSLQLLQALPQIQVQPNEPRWGWTGGDPRGEKQGENIWNSWWFFLNLQCEDGDFWVISVIRDLFLSYVTWKEEKLGCELF